MVSQTQWGHGGLISGWGRRILLPA